MGGRIGGFRRKTRHKLQKSVREKGKLSLKKYFQTFEVGQKVLLKGDSTVQKAMYNPKFHGKVGIIKGKEGVCYQINVKDMNKEKTLVVHPVHLESA